MEMKITKKIVTIRELIEGYVNDSELDPELGVYALNGKLCVRPEFQRSFIYNPKEANAVIDTLLKGYPIGIFYWHDHEDGTYDCMDGQQRTICICDFVNGISSYIGKAVNEEKRTYISTLKRIDPDKYEHFMNYTLDIYICRGPKAEVLEWFKTINIAGKSLTTQELRNINYTSPWLTDAKRYFSRANASGKKCSAEINGGDFTNKNANRQELLEQVITWYIGSTEDEDICDFMESCVEEPDAKELWNYFNQVIDWAKYLFQAIDTKKFSGFKTIDWGKFYAMYSEEDLDPDEITEIFNKLVDAKAAGELTCNNKAIIEYCITRDNQLLTHRTFSDYQKDSMYRRQKYCCADCGKTFKLNELNAHHIISWWNGGKTELDNGVLICNNCHNKRHYG